MSGVKAQQPITPPPLLARPRKYQTSPVTRAWLPLLAGFAVISILTLYIYNPVENRFYPFCFFYQTTGYLCPGCGSLRAAHNLLHGHFIRAFQCNCLVVIAMLLGATSTAWMSVSRIRNRPAGFDVKPWTLWFLLAVLVTFSVLRNLPLPPSLIVWLRP